MKIVNIMELMKCQPGTVVAEWKPCIMGPLLVLGSTYPDNRPLGCAFQAFALNDVELSSESFIDLDDEAKVEHDNFYRSGPGHKETDLFVIFAREDVLEIKERLERCLVEGYK